MRHRPVRFTVHTFDPPQSGLNTISQTTPSTSFKRRLVLTGVGFLISVVLSVAAVLLASRQHTQYLERSAAAQEVYASYRAISDHTYRKLSSMAAIVERGSLLDIEERYRNQKALRDALSEVKESIDAELRHAGEGARSTELEYFTKIAALAEQIINGSERVRSAIEANDRVAARQALDALRSPEIEGAFNSFIDAALEEELREVRETQRVANALNALLTTVAPFAIVVFLLVGLILITTTWRSLTRSLNAFEQAVRAYREGDFGYRIQKVDEAEFSELAVALNGMASEIATQRERERVSQAHLEQQIGLRTHELEQSNSKLATISELRKQFLADISHELRTPLTIIQGEADVALRGGVKSVEQYEDALTRVREQSVHTARLVQDLLFVARAEDGKAPLHKRAVAVSPLVKEVCADIGPLAAERGIEIAESYRDTDLVAELDAGRIKQVVTILIDNAIKYSHRNGRIDVTVAGLDQTVELKVIDNGIGMSFDQSEQVFTRFFRGNDGLNSPSGAGLGLPVAKAIIDAHDGHISLTAQEGQGTTATVRLPLATQFRAVQ